MVNCHFGTSQTKQLIPSQTPQFQTKTTAKTVTMPTSTDVIITQEVARTNKQDDNKNANSQQHRKN